MLYQHVLYVVMLNMQTIVPHYQFVLYQHVLHIVMLNMQTSFPQKFDSISVWTAVLSNFQ